MIAAISGHNVQTLIAAGADVSLKVRLKSFILTNFKMHTLLN